MVVMSLLLISSSAAGTSLRLVEVISSPARTQTLKDIIGRFEKSHPGTTVQITSLPFGAAFEKFATMISAGDSPDVVEMPDTWVALYARNGALVSLEPYLAKWEITPDLNERVLRLARQVDGKTAYTLPYGIYMYAMYYNRTLLRAAGVAAPPTTINEFLEASRKVAALPGKYGYCLRGGRGGFNDWTVFSNAIAGNNQFFHPDGTSTLTDPDKIQGLTFFIDYYRRGLAPRDSISWGFNEMVAGFYAGVCAMMNQDSDVLIAIEQYMKAQDYGVAPLPKGPSGRAYPTIGYAGWSMLSTSLHKKLAWELIAWLEGPQGNLAWGQRIGILPALKSAATDPFYAQPKFKAWFDELADENVFPTALPSHLKEYAYFKDSLVPASGQRALLGDIGPAELARLWATYLSTAQQKFLQQH